MNREEKEYMLEELKNDLAICRQALRDIVSGKRKQSYGLPTISWKAFLCLSLLWEIQRGFRTNT